MVDTVDAATRSRMMAGIGSRNTRPELLVRRQLHARGFRYTLDGAGLPGRPDIVLPKWKVAIFINGCFWHWHGCHLSKIPDANRTFWETKLMTNQTRDDVSQMAIVSAGWRVALVWECALRGQLAESKLPRLMQNLERWIRGESKPKVLELPSATNPRVSQNTK
jgi:DNA mismatch endonuclease, patch repair protein